MVPTSAEFVIIGGGIIGCSIAYHLAKAGKTDIVVLEQFQLTHGATWHAAGVVGQLRPSRNVTRMLQKSIELYDTLEADTGQAIDWKKVGSLRIASSKDRMKEYKRSATTAKSFGLEMHLLSPKEAQDLFPIMTLDGVEGATYIDSDGYVDPASLCQALAAGARKRGVKFVQNCQVTGFKSEGRRVVEVQTSQGNIRAETVVNASGMWGHELGKMMGTRVPAFAVEHQYLITDPIPDLPKGMPTVRDPDLLLYWKPEVRGIVVGGYEPNTVAFARDGIPAGWDQRLIQENYERFEQLAINAAKRTPVVGTVGVRAMINGAIPISADGDFVMGRVSELDNVFVSCGFIYGIAAAGGAGAAMAEWILEGRPTNNLWPLDVRRFNFHHNTKYFMYDRAIEIYAKHYAMKWPVEERDSVRNIRCSPLYFPLKERGAVFGSRAGWERPNWFAPPGVEAVDKPSFDWPNWFEPVAEEHRHVRESVGLIDLSSFAKMEIFGPGALASLQRLAVADVDRPIGSLIYTQLCNERGGIEADVTFCRLEEDRFYVITGTAYGDHDFGWIRKHLPTDGSVRTLDVTSAYAVINICGPKARDVLAKVAEQNVGGDVFKYGEMKHLTVGAAPVMALRVSFTGELGYELHIPTEYAVHVYRVLHEAGAEFGIKDFGYRALNSLRIEKGYQIWATDISPDYSPYAAGLDWVIGKNKKDFIGREALEKIAAEGPDRKLCVFKLSRKVPVYGGEAILRNGKVLGVTTSADFGHTVGAPIVYGYVAASEAVHEDYDIEVYSEIVPATRASEPLYDPAGSRFTL
ncbi:FAD-dependent oxidoreductase [Hyphomicrobium sp. 99]|uniref:GcvT family protein n=1 Tax=Hyphomicrobium sp. 99 TaxID=1163419 RepID=UPI0005F7966C|nr:FAD-dependent oxidoreductase [Hyphomicrobium sp. 99]